MTTCPFNKENVCENCSLFLPNPTPSSAKPNGTCSIVRIATELHRLNEDNNRPHR